MRFQPDDDLEKEIETGAALQAARDAAQADGASVARAEVMQTLRQWLEEERSGAELLASLSELAAAKGFSTSDLRVIWQALEQEQEQAATVKAEAAALIAEADRQALGQHLTAAALVPPAIAHALEVRTRYLPTDGPSTVVPFLAAIAGVVKLGTAVKAIPAAGFAVPINIYAALVGHSGQKKSPTSSLLVKEPLAPLATEIASANVREREAWEADCRSQKDKANRPPEPQPKRLVVSSFTGEALAAQLEAQEKGGLGLLIHRDELAAVFGSLNQYRAGKGDDEQQLLELYDGGGCTSLRVTGDRHWNRSQVSIWGTVQPAILRRLVAGGKGKGDDDDDNDASGLWARFCFVPLPERAIPLPVAATPQEEAEATAAAKLLADTARWIYNRPSNTYSLSPQATERFCRYELSKQEAALGATIGAQRALYGKASGKVLRIAGLLHLLRLAAGEVADGDAIAADTIDRATCLVDHLDAWALGFHAEMATDGVSGLMRAIHRIAQREREPVDRQRVRERLSKAQRQGFDATTYSQTVKALEAGGWGETATGPKGGITYRAVKDLP